jgi:predicted Zn-dependent peptidase
MPTRSAVLASLLLALAISAAAGAQSRGSGKSGPTPAFPSEPPKPGTPRDFEVPEPRRFTLDNGLEVALVQWGTMPKARVALSVRSGNAFEKSGETWLADLTGDLMREGTTTRTFGQISEEAARMGGALSIAVTEDRTEIGGDVLSEYAARMIDLVADVVQHPK